MEYMKNLFNECGFDDYLLNNQSIYFLCAPQNAANPIQKQIWIIGLNW